MISGPEIIFLTLHKLDKKSFVSKKHLILSKFSVFTLEGSTLLLIIWLKENLSFSISVISVFMTEDIGF